MLNSVVVIDTETTGLDADAEILQCSIISGKGKVLLNEFYRPERHASWEGAMAVNGITPERVRACPAFKESRCKIAEILNQSSLVIGYNLPFDIGMLERNGVKCPGSEKQCDLMRPFAEVFGEWSDTYQTWKWQKLTVCAGFYGYKGGKFHDSLEDCKATLHCYLAMKKNGEIA